MKRRSAFGWLWAGQTASVFGTAIGSLAVPTIAIVTLHASPFVVGVLAALQYAAYPLIGLLAGVYVDRWSRRVTMLVTDVIRALALAWIPLAAHWHALGLAQIVAVTACIGLASAFFDIAYQALVPSLVDHDFLEGANARLEFSSSAAQVGGKAAAGVLIAWIGAPLAVVIDAVSFGLSGAVLAAIRAPEEHRSAPREPFLPAVRAGFAVVFGSPVLRTIVAATATSNFGSALAGAVYLVFAYRTVHVAPQALGFVLAIGNLGFLGALAAPRVIRAVGLGPTLIAAMTLTALSYAVLLLTYALPALPVLLASQLLITLSVPVYNVSQISLRQRLVPRDMLGRMTATMRTIGLGTMPLGALAGGALAGVIGVAPTIAVSAGVVLCAVPPLFAPALRRQSLAGPA